MLKKHYFVSSISLKAPSVAALVCSGLTGSIWKAKTKHQGYCCKRSLKTFRFPGTVSLGSNYTGCIWKNRISCYSQSARNLCRSPSEVWQKLLVKETVVPFPHLPCCLDGRRKILILLIPAVNVCIPLNVICASKVIFEWDSCHFPKHTARK